VRYGGNWGDSGLQSSNPVLSRLGETARAESQVLGTRPAERTMTLDDVVLRTVGLLVLTGAVAAVSWNTIRGGAGLAAAILGGSIGGLVLALVISFKRITNPLVISAYAVLQGLLLGVASRWFEELYPGIVVQAVIGTFGVFLGMAVLYKLRIIRATPRFTRFVIGALIGVVALSLVNLVAFLISGRQGIEVYTQDGEVGWLPIVFSLVCIGVGALTFILDFDAVEQGIRYGLPQRYAWYCAFGLLVGLIFLYWQILRLLSYVRR
jgi:uncharacterized YccA/Bax inhibitor family protein